jgi:hypothetical protein
VAETLERKLKLLNKKIIILNINCKKLKLPNKNRKKYHKMDLPISISINTPVEEGYTNVYV